MALTSAQQKEIAGLIAEIKQGTTVIGEIPAIEIVEMQLKNKAIQTMQEELKDPDGNPLIESYRNKIIALAQKCISNQRNTTNVAMDVVCSIFAKSDEPAHQYNNIKNWHQNQWEVNLDSIMGLVFELTALVTEEERIAYNS